MIYLKPGFIGLWVGFHRRPRLLSKKTIAKKEPHINLDKSQGGLEYSDSYFIDNDARFVFKFVRKAMDYGCSAANYLEVLSCQRDEKLWVVTMQDVRNQETFTLKCRSIVNATGPFVDALNEKIGIQTGHHHLFSKGVHLIVPQITQNLAY